ncbi:MAG TPA: phenylacetate--CoA ligase family protein [Syntrophobacteraceae bacterium]|nr:phenylacetate--CoA ligase family protein [Syntrophobacteraceae bacterium]
MPVWNEREECLGLEERVQQQWERLQSSLNRAHKNVPFYRNHFREEKIDPAQMETLSDWERIPFTFPRHFGENYPYGLFAVPLRDVVRIHTARGIELKPIVSGYTKQDIGIWREIMARALTAAGVSRADILQIDLDPGLANWGRHYKDGAESIEAGVIPLTLLPHEKQLMVLRDYKTSVLITSTSAALQLKDLLFRANLNPNSLSLKTLILVGEPTGAAVQRRIEEELHVRTWVHYGLSEVPGPGLAFQCEERQGLHVSEDHFFPEVVDPETGRSVPEESEGELVLTTLTTRAFPLIRFRTGDRVRIFSKPCPCGRTLRRMEWLPHRTDEMMIIRGVKVHHRQVLLLLSRFLGFSPHPHRFLVRRREFIDTLEVWLKVDEQVFSDEIKEMEKLCQRLEAELAQELGVPVKIRLKEEDSFSNVGSNGAIEDLRP